MRSFSSLAEAFLQSAAQHRPRPALWCRGQILTYGELRDSAAAIAGLLINNQWIEPGERVAILSDRTPTVYIGILAGLLAGAAYVPLNPRYPIERNRMILERSGARVLVCDERHRAILPSLLKGLSPCPSVILPESGEEAALVTRQLTRPALESALAKPVLPENTNGDSLAYVLFTSGSTGVPKGVPISHANVLRYVRSATEISGVTAEDRIIQLADLTFDFSVHDIFLTWLNGAMLWSVPENSALLATRFVEENEITGWASVPSTAGFLKKAGALVPGGMPHLRFSFFCGEALPGALAETWAAAAPNSALINLYGPTEATVAFSAYRYQPGQPSPPGVVSLGWPLPEQHMGLFTSEGTRCQNELGEICLSGSQVMVGYWMAPEMTAERFFEAEGRRWYRTGDLGRFDPEVGYLYAGRVDRQVKIRGFRVELQEIETVVRRITECDVVAVMPWPTSAEGGVNGCVAFVMGPMRQSRAIIDECARSLPDYMVPREIIFVPELPVNSNGKVDYGSLRNHPALSPSHEIGQ